MIRRGNGDPLGRYRKKNSFSLGMMKFLVTSLSWQEGRGGCHLKLEVILGYQGRVIRVRVRFRMQKMAHP